MANVSRKGGLVPVKYMNGKAYTGATKRFYKSASVVLGIGDPVIMTGTGESVTGIPSVTRYTAGSDNLITGVVVAIDPISPSKLNQRYLASGDTGYVQVAIAENDLLFEAEEDGDSSQLAVTDIGRSVDLVTALDADTTTGLSKVQLDSSSVGTSNQCLIVEKVQRDDNALGVACKWLVLINQSNLKSAATDV